MGSPGFGAEASLYRTRGQYRMAGAFGLAGASLRPAAVDWNNPAIRAVGIADIFKDGFWIDPRSCCRDCLAHCYCADESCRRQCHFSCTVKCHAQEIGGCGCPPGRTVCQGICCGADELCTADGCCPPKQVSNNRCCGPFDRHTQDGCCPPGRTICNGRCCGAGESCTGEGCCAAGVCCESAPCAPGEFCCGGSVCCTNGAECRPFHGTATFACFDGTP